MKFRLLLIPLFFLCFSCLIQAQSTVLRITKTDNSTSSFDVSQLNTVMFNDTTMIVELSNGTVNNFPINTIRSFVVRDITGINEIQAHSLIVYPNPATTTIQLLNLEAQTQPANVYAVTGQLLLVKPVSSTDNTIDVSVLKQGIYILKLNGQTIKFSKK